MTSFGLVLSVLASCSDRDLALAWPGPAEKGAVTAQKGAPNRHRSRPLFLFSVCSLCGVFTNSSDNAPLISLSLCLSLSPSLSLSLTFTRSRISWTISRALSHHCTHFLTRQNTPRQRALHSELPVLDPLYLDVLLSTLLFSLPLSLSLSFSLFLVLSLFFSFSLFSFSRSLLVLNLHLPCLTTDCSLSCSSLCLYFSPRPLEKRKDWLCLAAQLRPVYKQSKAREAVHTPVCL